MFPEELRLNSVQLTEYLVLEYLLDGDFYDAASSFARKCRSFSNFTSPKKGKKTKGTEVIRLRKNLMSKLDRPSPSRATLLQTVQFCIENPQSSATPSDVERFSPYGLHLCSRLTEITADLRSMFRYTNTKETVSPVGVPTDPTKPGINTVNDVFGRTPYTLPTNAIPVPVRDEDFMNQGLFSSHFVSNIDPTITCDIPLLFPPAPVAVSESQPVSVQEPSDVEVAAGHDRNALHTPNPIFQDMPEFSVLNSPLKDIGPSSTVWTSLCQSTSLLPATVKPLRQNKRKPSEPIKNAKSPQKRIATNFVDMLQGNKTVEESRSNLHFERGPSPPQEKIPRFCETETNLWSDVISIPPEDSQPINHVISVNEPNIDSNDFDNSSLSSDDEIDVDVETIQCESYIVED